MSREADGRDLPRSKTPKSSSRPAPITPDDLVPLGVFDDDEEIPPLPVLSKSQFKSGGQNRKANDGGSRPSSMADRLLEERLQKRLASKQQESDPDLDKPGFWNRVVLGGRPSAGQMANLCRQWSQYQMSGIDLIRAIKSLQKRFANTGLGPPLSRVLQGIKQGDELYDALEREPKTFDAFFLAMIGIAESRGGIPETLRELAKHYEARQRLIRQARSALIYPAAVLLVATGVVALLTFFVLPVFAEMLRDILGRGASLPLPSRVLMAFSDFMQMWGWWLIPMATIGGAVVFVGLYRRSRAFRWIADSFALKSPVLGTMLRLVDETRLARALSALLQAGVDIQDSMRLTASLMRMSPHQAIMEAAGRNISDGDDLALAISSASRGRFDDELIAVVETGEESGQIPEALAHLADSLEERLQYMAANLGSLLKPIITIGLGGLVLFIILAVFLPYLSLLTGLS